MHPLAISSGLVPSSLVVTVHYFLVQVAWPLFSLSLLWLVTGSFNLIRGFWHFLRIWPGQVLSCSSYPWSSHCPGMMTGTAGPSCWLITPQHGSWPWSAHLLRGIMRSPFALSCLYHHICNHIVCRYCSKEKLHYYPLIISGHGFCGYPWLSRSEGGPFSSATREELIIIIIIIIIVIITNQDYNLRH